MKILFLRRGAHWAGGNKIQSTLLCRARSSAEHASSQSTLLCRARFFAEHSPLQSTLLCGDGDVVKTKHSPLQSTLLCRARFFAEEASLQSTLLCRARSFAGMETSQLRARSQIFSVCEDTQLEKVKQSTLLCRTLSFAEHSPLQSTLLCRARFFAEHSPLQSTLLSSTTTLTWACGLPARTSTTTSPSSATGLLRNGRKKLARSLQGGVPGPRSGDHPGQAAQLAAGERAGRGAHLTVTEEQVAQRVRQQEALDPVGRWVVSTQSTQYRNSRVETPAPAHDGPEERDACLRSVMRAPAAGRAAAAERGGGVRRLGISAEEVREFCVWRNAPMRVLSSQSDLVDSYNPALKEHRTVCFLAFDGHCYMYRAVKRALERQAARVLYQGKAQTLPPVGEWRRFDAADVQPGGGPARGEAPAQSPKVAISSPAQYCGLRLRRGTRIQELPQNRGRGQRLDLPEAAEGETRGARRGGEAEDPGRAGRQARAVRLRADLELDHVAPARHCHSEKTLHQPGEPGGARRHGVRPEPPPCLQGALLVGVDVAHCRRNGLANAPPPPADPAPGRRR